MDDLAGFFVGQAVTFDGSEGGFVKSDGLRRIADAEVGAESGIIGSAHGDGWIERHTVNEPEGWVRAKRIFVRIHHRAGSVRTLASQAWLNGLGCEKYNNTRPDPFGLGKPAGPMTLSDLLYQGSDGLGLLSVQPSRLARNFPARWQFTISNMYVFSLA